jgi:site-specific recombinase XerD
MTAAGGSAALSGFEVTIGRLQDSLTANLTQREVDKLIEAARKHGRYGHRDATMILIAYRHGLRASELCD